MIVSKFGGSSVADADQIRKVAAILKADENRTVVVVSAPGKRSKTDTKVTDMLYECDAQVRRGVACDELFAQVALRFTSIAKDLGLPENILDEALAEVGHHISVGFGPDYAASRGEYLSGRLIAAYMNWTFLEPQDLVLINENGTVADETYAKIAAMVKEGGRYVFPGFYGSTADGKVKTFSRGGSDISGSIVARAIGAALYENWTDVSGVFMADPRLIADAKVITRMSYREVRELAAVGFSVFHEEAIAPVRDAGIPIQVKNTNKPQDAGTSIVSSREGADDPIVGVTGKSGYGRLSVQKLLLFKRPGIRHLMETTLKTLGIAPEFTLTGIDSIVWFFPIAQVAGGSISSIGTLLTNEFALDDVHCDSGYAITAITGEGLRKSKRLSGMIGSLLEKNIEVEFVNLGASPITCLVGVPETQMQTAVAALYDSLIR
ncbi:MAG: aspartate kinase [Spirochaetae bacterium HGW-Spirochaetae-8]|jgi:aspartate kinase|nr:MAG: aspartate kinase [Spirochaetae bacterium HGW-Spirochaetae-8]